MNRSEALFRSRCRKGYQAVNLCWDSTCERCATMCRGQECQCHNDHTYCINTISIQKLIMIFDKKSQSLLPLYKLIAESLERQFKLIKIQLQEVRKIIDSEDMKLAESENKLYSSLLIEMKADIFPKTVAEAMNSLKSEPQYDISSKIIDVQKELQNKQNELKKILEEIRKLGEVKQITSNRNVSNIPLVPIVPAQISITKNQQICSIQFKFSPKLKHEKLTLINDKAIKINQYLGYYLTAFLEPNILKIKSKKCIVQLRINETFSGALMFGVCQMTPNIKVTDQNVHKKIKYGSLSESENAIYLGMKAGHQQESSNINRFQQKDIIEVQYEEDNSKITVRNITQKTKSVSYIQIDNSFPLYFAVSLNDIFDQVQIIKGEFLNQ